MEGSSDVEDDLGVLRGAHRRRVLEAAGFNAILFPAALVAGAAERLLGVDADPRPSVPPAPLNALLTAVFSAEKYLLRGLVPPYGLSRIARARTPTAR